jgi:hypothetical protein
VTTGDGLDARGKMIRFTKSAVDVPIPESVQSASRNLHTLLLGGRGGVLAGRKVFRECSLSSTASSAVFENTWDFDVTHSLMS